MKRQFALTLGVLAFAALAVSTRAQSPPQPPAKEMSAEDRELALLGCREALLSDANLRSPLFPDSPDAQSKTIAANELRQRAWALWYDGNLEKCIDLVVRVYGERYGSPAKGRDWLKVLPDRGRAERQAK
jgi:hypothetical protein